MEYEIKREKLEQLYTFYSESLFYVANEILRDENLAEDAVHNTFLKLIKSDLLNNIHKVKSYAAKNYLVKATRSIAINMLIKQKREKEFIEKEYTMFLSRYDNKIQEIYDKLSVEELVITIKKLPKKYRHALILKYFYQCTDKEIATICDIKVALVRKWIERAKKRLRIQYEKDFPDKT